MFETPEEFVRAVEETMTRDSSKEKDRGHGDLIHYGRACYREFADHFKRLAAPDEELTLENYIKRCIAIDFVWAKRGKYSPSHVVETLGKLFNVTPSVVAKEEALYYADYMAA